MADDHTEAGAKLQKLGQRLRSGFAKRHPVSERSLQTVRDAVRAEHERTQEVRRALPPPPPSKEPPRPPKGPDMGR